MWCKSILLCKWCELWRRELGRVITHQLGWDATSGEDVLQLRSARCRCHVTVVQYLYPPRVVVHYYHVVLSLRQTGSLILSAMALWVEELSSVAPSVASVWGLDNGRKHPVCAWCCALTLVTTPWLVPGTSLMPYDLYIRRPLLTERRLRTLNNAFKLSDTPFRSLVIQSTCGW